MLKMAQVDYIRYLRETEGCSIQEIARRLEISWTTAKKYADGELNLQKRPRQRRERPVMGPYAEIVDAWLEQDQRSKRKQRLTAKRIHQKLLKEGFKGSARTVRAYVREKRQELKEAEDQYVRLKHEPGEAQVDFGVMYVLDAKRQELVQYPYLNVSFPYSNAGIARVTMAENGECLLNALAELFEVVGGVPQVIVFDNLSPVVKKIESGTSRSLTAMFKEFQAYYGFEARFCNANRGNEKGSVEAKVKYHRLNQMTPMPVIYGQEDISRFNDELVEEFHRDRQRQHYKKQVLIEELWQEEQAALHSLPQKRFVPVRHESARVNKYGEIVINDSTYHVGAAHPGQEVFVQVYWDKLRVLDRYGEREIQQCPRHYAHRTEAVDWAAELKVFTNKPRALEQALYLEALPERVRNYLLPPDLNERRRRVRTVIQLLEDYSITDIAMAAETALECGKCDEAYLRAILEYNLACETTQVPLTENWTPEQVACWQPELTDYNLLCEGRDLS